MNRCFGTILLLRPDERRGHSATYLSIPLFLKLEAVIYYEAISNHQSDK